jgi:hypothetical protein
MIGFPPNILGFTVIRSKTFSSSIASPHNEGDPSYILALFDNFKKGAEWKGKRHHRCEAKMSAFSV